MKKIKYLFMSLVVFVCFLSPMASASASNYSTGKAVIPFYSQDASAASYYFVSNITDSPISVTVTLYNNDGTLVTDDNSSTTGRITGSAALLNFDDQNTDSTLTFTLNAHCTGSINLLIMATAHIGYGVIQWSQSGTTLQAMVVWSQLAVRV